jgi:hypothetical protein
MMRRGDRNSIEGESGGLEVLFGNWVVLVNNVFKPLLFPEAVLSPIVKNS